MLTKKSVFSMFLVLLVVLLVTSTASARPLQAPLGTGFTYQGKLTDAGVPANGIYDFQFSLYTDLAAGSQVGSTVSLEDVTVAGGLFTVQLDFGNVFDGSALYLEIGVRPGASTGAYTTLTPRQPLTPAPYAIYSASSPWSGLTGMPAGFADGVDNGSSYQNIKIVAKSGGDFTTITAALNSISDASASNPYLVFVAPGVYSEQVTMKEYVDIQGAGEQATTITFTGSSNQSTGTVVGANNAELRFLKVENTGGYGYSTYANAIYNGSTSPRLTHVTASASGSMMGNKGVWNNAASTIMTDVTATATATGIGFMANYGVVNSGGSPKMTNVIANASGAEDSYGVYNYDVSNLTMTNVTATATGRFRNYGLYNYYVTSLTIQDSSFSASGGYENYGIYNYVFSGAVVMTINNSQFNASGDSSYGVFNNPAAGAYSCTILINNSQITGSTNTISNAANYTTRVGASLLSGGTVSNSGTLACAGVYDENYTFYASTCP